MYIISSNSKTNYKITQTINLLLIVATVALGLRAATGKVLGKLARSWVSWQGLG